MISYMAYDIDNYYGYIILLSGCTMKKYRSKYLSLLTRLPLILYGLQNPKSISFIFSHTVQMSPGLYASRNLLQKHYGFHTIYKSMDTGPAGIIESETTTDLDSDYVLFNKYHHDLDTKTLRNEISLIYKKLSYLPGNTVLLTKYITDKSPIFKILITTINKIKTCTLFKTLEDRILLEEFDTDMIDDEDDGDDGDIDDEKLLLSEADVSYDLYN